MKRPDAHAFMNRSRYRSVPKAEIIAEYTEASRKLRDFEKAKWGSQESMFNRFRLGLSLIHWQEVKRWLDVGCGIGLFFTMAEEAGYRVDECIGVDITSEILAQAQNRLYAHPHRFIEADLENLPDNILNVDLVTLIGVLQQCGSPPERALSACIRKLKSGGQIFLTTKHIGWEAFTTGTLTPEPGHSWFDYDELAAIIEGLGVTIIDSGGFLPYEGKQVALNQSHTLYIFGNKEA